MPLYLLKEIDRICDMTESLRVRPVLIQSTVIEIRVIERMPPFIPFSSYCSQKYKLGRAGSGSSTDISNQHN